jgi:hypothetical protein
MIPENCYSNTAVKETLNSGNKKLHFLIFFNQVQTTYQLNISQKQTFQKGGILFKDIGRAQVNGE